MTTAETLFRIAGFVLTVLVNGLWLGALIAGAAWLILRIAKNASATTRHAVLTGALVAVIILPIATTIAAFRLGAAPVATLSAQRAAAIIANTPHTLRSHASVPPERRASAPSVTPADAAPRTRPSLTLPAAAVVGLVAAWFLGAAFLIVRLGISLFYLERLKRDALPLAVSYREHLERWAAVGKGTRDVRLCRSSEIATPIAVGIFDAMVLIPDHLIDDLAPDDLDRIILHEVAHLRRRDDWLNGFERIAEAMLFFNPACRWIVSQLELEREVACDDWVLERRSEALPYAECLVKLVEDTMWPYRPMVAPGVFVTRRSISIRIERLLAKQRDVRLRIAPVPLAALGALTIVMCALGFYIAPSIAAGGPSDTAERLAVVKPPAPATPAPPATPHVAPVPAPAVKPERAVPAPVAAPKRAPAAASPRRAAQPVTPATPGRAAMVAERATDEPVAIPTEEAAGDAHSQSRVADEDYISSLAALGYTHLSVDELVRMRSVGVTAEYIRAIEAEGFNHPAVDDLVKLRALGVTPDYIHDTRKTFPGATFEQLARMRALGVTPSFIGEMRAAGVHPLGIDDLTRLRALGVDPAYVRLLAAQGYPTLDADQLTRLRAIGVDAAFFDKLKAHGFHNLSLDDLVRLKTSGALD